MQPRGVLSLAYVFFGLLLALSSAGSQPAPAPASDSAPEFAVLLFTKTTGWRHESIPAGVAAIQALGTQAHFAVDANEDAAVFTRDQLAHYRVVIFLNTTGNILDTEQQAALEQFIRQGGGFVGIHSATDTEYDWPWYGRLVGAYFASHPAIQPATVRVVNATHPSTKPLPATWTRQDEWYNFRAAPPVAVHVLLTIDETSYSGGSMGAHHPLAWYHQYDGGRAWYTAMGHTTESYSEPLFLQHVLGGIRWAAGVTTD
jgi:type 1 glutamine amidotransferase